MLKIEVTGLDSLRQELQGFSERRLQAAGATALTRTARRLADEWRRDLESSFDRPTPATTAAVQVKMATAAFPVAEVSIKSSVGKASPVEWLSPHERGGARSIKKFEEALQAQGAMRRGTYAVPGPAAKLDAFGNVRRAQIVQVIAQLGASYSPGYARVISPSAAKRAAKAVARGRAYIAFPERQGRRAAGVYERAPDGRLRAVFYFVSRASYDKRLRLIERAQSQGPGILAEEVQRAIAESAGRLAARGG